jgi:adenylate cyclase, class 2
MSEQEIEVKFYINNLPRLARRLQAVGAELVQPRVHELNLRFDTPDGALTRAECVLRLRQDRQAYLTYKGPNQEGQAVSVRQEIEFVVSSFESAHHFLEALGYQVSIMYEKQRTTYLFRGMLVTLDEMPFGTFAEIEGPDPDNIHSAADTLSLNWDTRCTQSYLVLFDKLRAKRALSAKNLSFAELENLSFSAEDFDLVPADN